MDADTQTLTPMPEGFYWKPRCHLDTLPTGLFLHGEQVASMQQRVDGSWLARLTPEDGVHAPLLLRDCSSFDAGRRGCEMWALRHEQVLRRKVAKKLQWIQDNVVLRGRGLDLGPDAAGKLAATIPRSLQKTPPSAEPDQRVSCGESGNHSSLSC